MSIAEVVDASKKIRWIVSPWGDGERTKSVIARAASRTGLSYWRAFDIWYCKARRIEAFEITQILEAVADRQKELARNELQDIKIRVAQFEAMLARSDPDFTRTPVDLLGSEIREERKPSRR